MKNFDINDLDKIVKTTIAAVEQGKTQIFDIYEAARNEVENIKKDVERTKQETVAIIFTVDDLEKKERRSRMKLMEVSRNFNVYTEEDIKAVYDEARNLQVDLAVARAQEQNLRQQRDELEIRLRSLKNTVSKAEGLTTQVGAVLGYLGDQMGNVVVKIESLQQNQIFGAKIIKAQEEERRRVSREIHDGPAQSMANIVFRAEVCERLIDIDVVRAKKEIEDLRSQVRLCLKETRKIIFDLRPMTLDDLGLVPTVKRFLDTVQERSGIIPEVRILGEERRLDSYVEVGIFRIFQEAITNVEKHANASSISIVMEFRRDALLATIVDDGKGFDTADNVGSESFGLLGMRERVNLLNGELTIKSETGIGTKIIVKINFQ
ncbi:MAG: DegS sensor signal transduction histidine kinase [Pelosinus sp.]|jgi:two-component system sensor histidine kinase DegS|nr:DegS sensor signal transduction histidine kinase [Pelosinus sp.]